MQNIHLFGKAEFTYNSEGLFATEQVTLLGQSLCSDLVTLEGCGHLLILQPLVADELQLIITLSSLQILVGDLDELVSQLILLLQRGVCQ